MERQLRWYVQLIGFYQALVAIAVAIGFVAVMTGILEQSPAAFFMGVLWIVGGPAVVWFATEREDG